MSLIIHPYTRNTKNGELKSLEDQLQEPFNELFGSEAWRHTVWGSACLKKMNCQLLSSLKEGDVYVENKKIAQLKSEIVFLKEHIIDIADELNLNIDSFEFRLNNALEVIRIAQNQVNGGVYIG